MTRIRHLEELESQRVSREKSGLNSGSGISGFFNSIGNNSTEEAERSKTLALHRAGILWYLNDSLKNVSQQHTHQQGIRLERQLQRTKNAIHNVSDTAEFSLPAPTNDPSSNTTSATSSSLYDSNTGSSTTYTSNLATFDSAGTSSYEEMPAELRDLTPQQVQELETENNALLDELELSLDKAKASEKSLMEISALQSSLSAHISTQNEHIQSLVNDSVQVHEDISNANKQLDRAKARNRRASKIIVSITLIFAFILLFYDALLS